MNDAIHGQSLACPRGWAARAGAGLAPPARTRPAAAPRGS